MARADRRRKEASGAKKRYPMIAGLLAVAAVVVGYMIWGASGGSAATELVELEGVTDPQELLGLADGVAVGDSDAPVTILEFGDYQCPACRDFAFRVKPTIEREYVGTGDVRFVFYDFPLPSIHAHAFLAARAARCAGEQSRYWDYHDELFSRQAEWSARSRAPVGEFVDYAEALDLNVREFEGCLESDRYADVVTAGRRLGEQIGVNGTPTLIVNSRRILNPLDREAVLAAIDAELDR